MEILKTVENEDGSTTLTLDISEEENRILIQYAVINLLEKYIESQKKGNTDE